MSEFISNYTAGADIRSDSVDLSFTWKSDDGTPHSRAFSSVTLAQAVNQAVAIRAGIRQELVIQIIRLCARLVAGIDSP